MQEAKKIKEFTKPTFVESTSSTRSPPCKVFVTGATGTTGSATIQHLLQNFPLVQIVAGVRDLEKGRKMLPSNIHLARLEDLPGSKDSLQTVANLMTGCQAVLIVPPEENRVEVGKALVEAAEMAKVRFICLISVAAISDNAKDQGNSLLGHQFSKIETAINATGIKHAFLRCELFMENHLWDASRVKKDRTFSLPVAPDAPYCPVATSDVGAMAAAVMMRGVNAEQYEPIGLPQQTPLQKIYHLTSSKVTTMTDIASVYSKIVKTDIKYVQVSHDQSRKQLQQMGVSLAQAEGLVELYERVNKGCNKTVSSDIEEILQRKALTMEEFLVSHKKEFV